MSGLLIGYARVSTSGQDLSGQVKALEDLGVAAERSYVDHGLTGTNRDRPGLREALAACRAGDTLIVTKLDRLARSLPDVRDIGGELVQRGVKLSFAGQLYDPADPVGRLLFNVLGVVAEFEADLIRSRTREGMAIARSKGRLRGRQPKLSSTQEAHPVKLHDAGEHTAAELAELFGVGARPCTEPSAAPTLENSHPDATSRSHAPSHAREFVRVGAIATDQLAKLRLGERSTEPEHVARPRELSAIRESRSQSLRNTLSVT